MKYTAAECLDNRTREGLQRYTLVKQASRFIKSVTVGGKKILLKVGGTDASKQFDSFHNSSILAKFGTKFIVGDLVAASEEAVVEEVKVVKPVVKAVAKVEVVHQMKAAEEQLEGLEEGDSFGDGVPFGDPYWYSDWHTPYYNDSHRKIRAVMRQWVEKEAMNNCFDWDEAKQLPRSIFVSAAKAGILQACVGHVDQKYCEVAMPGDIPFDKFDNFHEFICCDELSRTGSGGFLWGLIGGLGIGLPPVINFGSDYLKDKVVKECLAGRKNICLAITEPSAGSDVANLTTEAKRTADGTHFLLNGEKKWITNGVFADFFTVACRTGGPGMNGVTLLLVERSMAGVQTRQMQCSGVWASGTAYVTFEDVLVPANHIIGEENKGFKAMMYNFNHERMGICIQATRFARVCYEDSMKYAHKRETFGKKLIDHPVIRNKLAHMARKIESTHGWMESLLYQTIHMPADAQMLKLGGTHTQLSLGPIALLKAQSTQTMEYCAREAAQIFGGLSYSRGGQGERVERLYREVRAYAIPGGSEEIMLDLGIRQAVKVAQFMGAKL